MMGVEVLELFRMRSGSFRFYVYLNVLAEKQGLNGYVLVEAYKIAKDLGVSRQAVYDWLKELEQDGVIKRVGRGLYQILKPFSEVLGLKPVSEVAG